MNITDKTQYKIYASGAVLAYCPTYSDGSQLKGVDRSLNYSFCISKMKVQSLCCALWRQKRGKILYFWTVTIPESIDEKEVAVCWNRYLTLLRNKNKIHQYVWIKEKQKNGNVHYHVLSDSIVSKLNIKYFQETWEFCLITYCNVFTKHHNSVRLGNKPYIYNVQSVRYYLSKYIAKGNDKKRVCYFEAKACGYSQGLITDIDCDRADIEQLSKSIQWFKYFEDDFFNLYVMKSGKMSAIFEFFDRELSFRECRLPINYDFVR